MIMLIRDRRSSTQHGPLRLYFVLEKIMDIYAKFKCAKICRIYIYKKVQNIQSIVQKKNEANFYVNSIFIFFLIMLIKI